MKISNLLSRAPFGYSFCVSSQFVYDFSSMGERDDRSEGTGVWLATGQEGEGIEGLTLSIDIRFIEVDVCSVYDYAC